MWEGEVQVRDCPFDDKLYARIREEAIERIEDGDVDAAERSPSAAILATLPIMDNSATLSLAIAPQSVPPASLGASPTGTS
jgi:hypothetical protein